MISLHNADGGSATYSYDADNRLILISDASGRTVKISWHGGEVDAIDGPNGGVRYQYEQAEVITDENGARFATYAYDDFGSTVLSEHAGGVGAVPI